MWVLKVLGPIIILIAILLFCLPEQEREIINHRTLHEEHRELLYQERVTQESLQELHIKMDVLLNIATNVNRDIQFAK